MDRWEERQGQMRLRVKVKEHGTGQAEGTTAPPFLPFSPA